MRVIPVLGLSAALTLLMSGCRQQTGVDVEITTDVPCGTTRMSTGVQLGELRGAEITGESPQVVTEACIEGKPNRVGDVVVTASPGNDSATFRLTVVANLRLSESKAAISAEQCKAQKYVDCIVARRTLGFVPNEGLTLPIFLQNACASRICEEGTTCVADAQFGVRCVSSKIEQPKDCGSKPEGCVLPGPVAKPEDPEPPVGMGGDGGSGVGTTMPPAPLLYASTMDSFFKFDPERLTVGKAVPFKGCGDDKSVHDIAVTNDNKLYAITSDALFEVKPDGTCLPKGGTMKPPMGSGGHPYTLAFMPKGFISIPSIAGDPLIGQYDDAFMAISPETGAMSLIKQSPSCPQARGDVVVVKTPMGVNAYLTTKGGMGETDYLSQIKPADGTAMEGAAHWTFSMNNVLGLAYWGGFFYGFAMDGTILKMDDKTGQIVNKANVALPFYGAASPADAPTSP